MKDPTRPWELLVSLVVLGLGVAAWVLSSGFPRTDDGHLGPALFPKILSVVLVVSSLALILPNLRRPGLLESVESGTASRLLPIALLLGLLCLTPWIMGKIGLLWTTALFSVLAALLLGAKLVESLVLGAVMLGFVWAVFVQLLKVQA